MKRIAGLSTIAMLLATPLLVAAQSGRVEHAERRFDDIRFVMGSGQAIRWLEMYDGSELLGAFREFDVQGVHASPDGRYFLAVSNTARSMLAFAVLDRRGRIVFSSAHNADGMSYCNEPSRPNRYWVDAADPGVRFEQARSERDPAGREYLRSVVVRGCDGADLQIALASDPGPPRTAPAVTNLRGLDPTFGSRTLTLIEGRRIVQPATEAPAR